MIYLDHAATTPVNKEVLNAMYAFEEEVYGNPSSTHALGRNANMYLEAARKTLSEVINASENEIYFTSGGTEANNLAIIGTVLANKHKGNHIITTAIEHQAVLETMEYLAEQGFEITYLPVDPSGVINPTDLKHALTNETILVSIMTINNETGVIQPIETCGNILREHQAYFHTDAVQALALLELDVEKMGVDLLTVSAHKINGPKGIGMLFVRSNIHLQSTHFGGNQEKGFRPGTENIVGVIGFQKAIEIIKMEQEQLIAKYEMYYTLFIDTLRKYNVDFSINGEVSERLCSIVNLHFHGVSINVLLTNLDLAGIAASAGSACTAGTTQPSHVLIAMYDEHAPQINESIRFSFGYANTEANIVEAAEKIVNILSKLQKY